jgi:NitT/TauT family transport system substrate-binding protein
MFTNPADQKTALLAGSLDMCGTTAHAIPPRPRRAGGGGGTQQQSSALVVFGENIQSVADLRPEDRLCARHHAKLLREAPLRAVVRHRREAPADFFDMGTALAQAASTLSGEPFPALHEGYGRICLSVLRRCGGHHQCRHDRDPRHHRQAPGW